MNSEDLHKRMAANSDIQQPAAPMHRAHDERLSLSPEEQILINKLKNEASLYRGYPLALATAGLTTLMLRRNFPQMPKWRNVALSFLGGVTGNILGRVTYAPEMLRRLEKELPDDSELKKQIMSRRKNMEGGVMVNSDLLNTDQMTSQSSEASHYNDSSAYSQDSAPAPAEPVKSQLEDSKYVTYEELRKRHRQSLDWKQPKSEPEEDPSLLQPAPAPTLEEFPSRMSRPRDPPVRYNKYGDPILEP